MFIELPTPAIYILNIVYIPLAHLLVAKLTTLLPQTYFSLKETHILGATRTNTWIYEKLFLIRLWKDTLPDGGPWVNGFSKAKLLSQSSDYLKEFVQETKRGEISHYIQAALILLCLLWTPWPASLVIFGYACLSNLPCILNQRYIRKRMLCVLQKRYLRDHSVSDPQSSEETLS